MGRKPHVLGLYLLYDDVRDNTKRLMQNDELLFMRLDDLMDRQAGLYEKIRELRLDLDLKSGEEQRERDAASSLTERNLACSPSLRLSAGCSHR
jgi:hypothetical protein